jgi:hypothetical protein
MFTPTSFLAALETYTTMGRLENGSEAQNPSFSTADVALFLQVCLDTSIKLLGVTEGKG